MEFVDFYGSKYITDLGYSHTANSQFLNFIGFKSTFEHIYNYKCYRFSKLADLRSNLNLGYNRLIYKSEFSTM